MSDLNKIIQLYNLSNLLFGICNLSIVPIRAEPSEKSEMISQLLFGEHFTIIEKQKNYSKVKGFFDSYVGFIDNKQFEESAEDLYERLSTSEPVELSKYQP